MGVCKCATVLVCMHLYIYVCLSVNLRACICVYVCVCSKLTAAVKFLSEHHRGEADESWQGAEVKGGGRGRWRWEWSKGRRWLQASSMIEGFVKLCRNSASLSKNISALTAIVLTLSSVYHAPWPHPLRVKQLFYLNICRWCRSLAFGHCWIYSQSFINLTLYFWGLIFTLLYFKLQIIQT